MTKFVGPIALIRHPDRGEGLWLALWNTEARQFEFVTAPRLESESYRECIDREIAWRLRLRRSRDYIVSSVARLHLDAPLPSPGDAGVTFFVVEFYVVDLYGGSAWVTVNNNPDTRWLSSQELLSGECHEGKPVSGQLVMLLKKADVITNSSA